MRLDGRVAVVTGGALGIGAATSRRLAEAGATVVVADIDEAAATTTAQAIGGSASAAHVDVRDAASVDALADGAASAHGQIDIWVNNAGIYPNTPFMEMTTADWDLVSEVNTRGSFSGSQAAARHMIARGAGGVIINTSSINGYRAFGPGIPHYTTSKHALQGLTRALAVELGEHDIRVIAVCPTMVETEGVAKMRDVVGESGFKDAMDALASMHPSGRVGVPDDIARVTVFCCTDLAAMVNGSMVIVDGGYLAQ